MQNSNASARAGKHTARGSAGRAPAAVGALASAKVAAGTGSS